MSVSITSRRVRCSKYPWPMRTKETTVADIEAMEDSFPYLFLIGPLDMRGVMELIYRVETFDWEGETSGGDGESSSGYGQVSLTSSTENFPHIDDMEVPSEVKIFQFHRSRVKTGPDSFAYLESNTSNDILQPLRGDWGELTRVPYPVFADENGMFWLRSQFSFGLRNSDNPSGSPDAIITNVISNIFFYLFEADLILNAGDYKIKCYADHQTYQPVSASLTITATKWHSYGGRYNVDTGNLSAD